MNKVLSSALKVIFGTGAILGIILLFTYIPLAKAADLYVPTGYSTIQAAIDNSINGDVIIVEQGIYVENINFLGKIITIRSTDPSNSSVRSNTIIDGNQAGSVVSFHSGETSASVLSGFTIRNGIGNSVGGGILCYQSSPTIADCTISGNSASEDGEPAMGGGICCNDSSPTITGCTISGNSACTAGQGGGIYCTGSSPTITDCTISGNSVSTDCASTYGGGICCCYSSPTITNCIISGNISSIINGFGGGIYCQPESSLTITNCTIINNSASWTGGGIFCSGSSSATITNSIFWNNQPDEIIAASGTCSAYYSDIQGGYYYILIQSFSNLFKFQ